MAYSQVGTPRFYVNALEWLKVNGKLSYSIPQYNTLPVTPVTYDIGNSAVTIPDGTLSTKSFVAILGHNFGNVWEYNDIAYKITSDAGDWSDTISVINGSSDVWHNGFSISTFNGTGMYTDLFFDHTSSGSYIPTISSILIGNYYEMPHSPDLNLSISYEYDGVDQITTKGGSTLTNTRYSKPAKWGDMGAWDLGGYEADLGYIGRSGRRIFDLSFSYLDDGDALGLNQNIGISVWGVQDANDYDDDDIDTYYAYNILTDDSFYTQVVHRTNGGTIPFIFQPDKDDISNFAICVMDQKSIQFQQTAPGLYSVKLKLREVW